MKKEASYSLTAFVLVFLLHSTFSVLKSPPACPESGEVQNILLLSLYFEQQDFFLSFSYALAVAFTVYAFLNFFTRNRNSAVVCAAGGVTLTGTIYIVGCFLSGCCGSPMLGVYLGLLGPSFFGFTKPLIAGITIMSVITGYFWLNKKRKSCCNSIEKGP